MREIKFRAWDDEINHMYYPPDNHICLWCDGKCLNLQTGKKLIPMFWIGLKDRNGKEIWEGDIVKIYFPEPHIYEGETIKAIIELENGGFWWRGINRKITDCNWHFYNMENFEVIGNKFQNPEIVKE